MFCKNCGNNILDGKKFCPKCGKEVSARAGGSEIGAPFGTMAYQPVSMQSQKKGTDRKRLFIVLCTVVFSAVVVVGSVLAIRHFPSKSTPDILPETVVEDTEEEQQGIVGEWESEEMVSMQELVDALCESVSIPAWASETISESVSYLDPYMTQKIGLVFYESGKLQMSGEGIQTEVLFNYGYELMPNQKIHYDIELMGKLAELVPVSLSYNGTCRIDGDQMELDFFGLRLNMIRQGADM